MSYKKNAHREFCIYHYWCSSCASLEGVNAGPLHPIYYMAPLLLLSIFLLVWWRRKRKQIAIN